MCCTENLTDCMIGQGSGIEFSVRKCRILTVGWNNNSSLEHSYMPLPSRTRYEKDFRCLSKVWCPRNHCTEAEANSLCSYSKLTVTGGPSYVGSHREGESRVGDVSAVEIWLAGQEEAKESQIQLMDWFSCLQLHMLKVPIEIWKWVMSSVINVIWMLDFYCWKS